MRLIKIEDVSNVPLFLIKSQRFFKSIVAYSDIYVQKKDLIMAKRIMKKNNINYSIKNGNIRNVGYYVFVIVVLVSILISGILCAQNNSNRVVVECDDLVLAAKVKEYVQESFTIKQRKNDLLLIKESILQRYDDVAFCEINKIDSQLKIALTLARFNAVLEKGDNITAIEDGVITKIVIKSGTANIKIGDVVKKGEVLVSGKYVDYLEKEIDVVPEGRIYAKVYKKQSIIVPKEQLKKVYTGNKKTKYVIDFLSLKQDYNYNPMYENYSIRIKDIWPFNGRLCTVRKYEYCEYKYEKEDIDNVALNEIILNEQMEYMSNLAIKGVPINIRAIKKGVDNFYFIDIYYEIEQCISNTN